MPLSTYLINELLDHFLKVGSFTQPTNIYVSLHSADPGDTGANELSGGSYARVVMNVWDVAAAGASENTNVIAFATASGDWAQATHFGLWDAITTGNFLGGAALTTPRTVASGDDAEFAAGALDVSIT
jgi:hypothetical protein